MTKANVAVAKNSSECYRIMDSEGSIISLIPGDSGLFYEASGSWYRDIDHFMDVYFHGWYILKLYAL